MATHHVFSPVILTTCEDFVGAPRLNVDPVMADGKRERGGSNPAMVLPIVFFSSYYFRKTNKNYL
jgi:hypothetical protein